MIVANKYGSIRLKKIEIFIFDIYFRVKWYCYLLD
jgi:hypothetical protein